MYQNSEIFRLKRNEFVYAKSSGIVMNQRLEGKYAIEVKGDGNGIIMIIDNEDSNAKKITLMASDNVFCGGDKEIFVPGGGIHYVYLEAAPYVQKSGEHKGKILMEGQTGEAYFTCLEVL